MPKIAITGKGGVGKTTLAALLAHIYAEAGQPVYAIDADPAASLAYALGLPEELAAQITPIAEMEELIYERTGAKPGTSGGFFTINPRVDDIPDRFSVLHRGIRLLQLGTISTGGSGCICPESAILKSLVTHIILYRNEAMILDMEAGIEHLGRATAKAVDKLIVVVEPGRRSIDTAEHIRRLAAEIQLNQIFIVGNKIRGAKDEDFLRQHLKDFNILGFLPYADDLIEADLNGQSPYDVESAAKTRVKEMVAML